MIPHLSSQWRDDPAYRATVNDYLARLARDWCIIERQTRCLEIGDPKIHPLIDKCLALDHEIQSVLEDHGLYVNHLGV